jgi:oligoribonuclease
MGAEPNIDRMVWVDIETTGLDVWEHFVLEIGLAITDPVGNILASKDWVVKYNYISSVIESMSSFVKDMHTQNNLIDELLRAEMRTEDINEDILNWMRYHHIDIQQYPLTGSSIHFDRTFLKNVFETVELNFHYRNNDISTLRSLAKMHAPSLTEDEPKKRDMHRVLPDIEDSIKLYQYYLKNFLRVDHVQAQA